MYGVSYYSDSLTLILDKHDCGLLSNASVTFKALLSIHENIKECINIQWPRSIWGIGSDASNVYELFFKTIKQDIKLVNTYFDAMIGDCSKFNFKELEGIRDTYFNLSTAVINKQNFFMNKYDIDPEKTIGILYRGTDKILEVPRVDPNYYLKCLAPIKNISDYRIFIQTDQRRALDFYRRANTKCFNIEEMPMTDLDKAMHLIPVSERTLNNYELGVNYLAAVSILSKCKYVVFDTNNAGLWICIFRGSLKNTCQVFSTVSAFNRIDS